MLNPVLNALGLSVERAQDEKTDFIERQQALHTLRGALQEVKSSSSQETSSIDAHSCR